MDKKNIYVKIYVFMQIIFASNLKLFLAVLSGLNYSNILPHQKTEKIQYKQISFF